LKIGFDAKRIFHNSRGLGNYSRTLVESLKKYYPDNDLFLYSTPIKDKSSLDYVRRFDRVNIRTPEGQVSKAFSTLWRSLFLSTVLKEDKLDLYHGLSHELPPGIEKLNIKTVVTIHDLIFLRFPEQFPWIDRKVYLQKFKHACKVANKIIAICEQTKSDLIEFLNVPESKIEVVYQACHQSYYESWSDAEKERVVTKYSLSKTFILNVGALEERKNTLLLVKAFSRIAKDFPEHDLVLVGRGKEYKEKLIKTITSYSLTDRVHILDNVPTEDLPGLYQSCSLFAFPSLFEGFGIPIVEAMFSEAAVITSTGSCFPEAGGAAAMYINPHSVEDWAKGLSKVLGDEELARSMARNGRVYAEKFHWKNTSKELFNLYESLV
jgi:glycosyltransferase involved in cell wall biosynthesis